MSLQFVTDPDETGKGRIIVDGRYYGLPLEVVTRIKAMQDTLETFTQWESCDCGCPGKGKPVLFKPAHYYMLSKEALGETT